MGLQIDLDIRISGDSTELYIIDNSIGWGEDGTPNKVDIDNSVIIIKDKDDNVLLTINYPIVAIDNTLVVEPSDLGMSDTIEDAIYKYTYTLEDTGAAWSQTKNGEFVVYKTLERNIHSDLLEELNKFKAYNEKIDYEVLTEIRRRSNLLNGIKSAEFYAETDNIQNILDYLKILEK